jgi:hypothetical protein
MKKRTGFMLSLIFLLLGIIIGFLISPVKQGMGNNNGNSIYNYKDEPKKEDR